MIRTKKNDKTGCFECVSHKPGTDGYPRAKVDGKMDRVHRHMYRKFKGEIPEGKIVRHTCDNRRCCNPDHLILGTHADNARDREERKRGAYGEKNGAARLTQIKVDQIRTALKVGIPVSELASLFGVSPAAVYRVKNGRTWRTA